MYRCGRQRAIVGWEQVPCRTAAPKRAPATAGAIASWVTAGLEAVRPLSGYVAPVQPFPVLDVSTWLVAEAEPAGADEKLWLADERDSEAGRPPRHWLWKPVTRHPGWQQQDHWAEKIAAEVASLIGVPHAHYELARRGAVDGSLSLSVIPDGWDLQPGAVVLEGAYADYSPHAANREGHSLDRIRDALTGWGSPVGADLPAGFGAFDAFGGLCVLDALIANRDRHEENWAVLYNPLSDAAPSLSPAYDHARSLGVTLTEERRARHIRENSVEAWALRGTAHRFQVEPGAPTPTLVDLAARALALAGAAARNHWRSQVEPLEVGSMERGAGTSTGTVGGLAYVRLPATERQPEEDSR
jgi:hypothetical protein